MDEILLREILESLLFVFGPFLYWFLIIIVVASLLSAIGVIVLEDLPRIDPL